MTLRFRNSFVAFRHGKSLANAQKLIVSDPEVGRNEFGLTQEGKTTVINRAVEVLKLVGSSPRILSSGFLRARQTAEILGEKVGAEIETCRDLRERWFGDLEQSDDSYYQQVWDADRQDSSHHHWNVESVAEVCDRMANLVTRLDEEHENESFVLVSHGDPIQILNTWFQGLPLETHRERDPLQPGQLKVLYLV